MKCPLKITMPRNSGRKYKTRIKKHYNCWVSDKQESNFAIQLLENNHTYS